MTLIYVSIDDILPFLPVDDYDPQCIIPPLD